MTNDLLEKANKLKKEIEKLERFIAFFEQNIGWHYNGIKVKRKYIKKGVTIDAISETLLLNNTQQQKIFEMLKEDLAHLKQEFERLGETSEG